jgi:histidinol-phosphate aminotransferase
MGFGVANPQLLAGLFKVKDSYNIDAIAIRVGTAAMRDQAYKNECAAKVIGARAQLMIDLKQLGFEMRPSHGNFLLATVPSGSHAEAFYLGLKERGILVRYFNQPGLADKLRITVGTAEQNRSLLEALISLLQQ